MPVMILVGVAAVRTQSQPMPVIHDTALSVARPMAQPAAACAEPPREPGPRARPVPAQEHHGDQGGRLDAGGESAEHDPGQRAMAPGYRQAGQEQAEHERVVVRAPDQGGQHQGGAQTQDHGRGGVPPGRPGQHRDGPQGHGQAGHRQQAKQDQVGQYLVAGQVGDEPVEPEERRPIRRRRVGPEGPRQDAERREPEDAGAVDIRADAVRHHLTLAGVVVEVPAEQGRGDGQGHGPHADHAGHPAHRHPAMGTAQT